jgi:hypothetical protein
MTAARRSLDERGTALLLALGLTAILGAIAAVVAVTARAETLIAGRFHQAREAQYAAEGALARALQDLASAPEWESALAGASSSFRDGDAATPREVAGSDRYLLCCGVGSVSASIQQAGNGGWSWGADTPQWRLYAWGPVGSWLPAGVLRSPFYVAVWVADDSSDGDGDPFTDANGVVALYSIALGPGGGRRAVRAVVGRPRDGAGAPLARGVQILSWHETRW